MTREITSISIGDCFQQHSTGQDESYGFNETAQALQVAGVDSAADGLHLKSWLISPLVHSITLSWPWPALHTVMENIVKIQIESAVD